MSRNLLIAALSAVAVTAIAGAASATTATDTVQAPTGFFVPTDALKTTAPYYRRHGQDWGWTQGAIAGAITSASLNISAYDVDAPPQVGLLGEVDNIYAYDNGVAVLLGSLQGGNNIWAFSNFVLGANFFDDINAGLQVFMTIDNNNEGWAVTLGKSSLSIDGGVLPPPTPGVPEPATWALMLMGFGAAGAALRSRRRSALTA
jgi:hypothetical protein